MAANADYVMPWGAWAFVATCLLMALVTLAYSLTGDRRKAPNDGGET